jgi:hypothetical protein
LIGESSFFLWLLDCPVKPDNDKYDIRTDTNKIVLFDHP